MTDFTIPGKAHGVLPKGIDPQTTLPGYAVMPWLCPACEQTVAETVAEPDGRVRSVPPSFDPVRDPTADQDGVPFYGPSRRAMRGRSQRRVESRLRREATRRAWQVRRGSEPSGGDYSPITEREFDTICENCPRRVRIRLAAP